MEVLEETMNKHNINLDSSYSSNYYSHGHALSNSILSFNAMSTSSSYEWLIDCGASYNRDKDKTIFSTLNECNTKQIFVGDDISHSVVGSRTIQIDKGHFNGVLCVSSLSCNLLNVY
jgi:hypothetical protein